MCCPTMGDVRFVGDTVSMYLKDVPDTTQTPWLTGIDQADMIFVGTFSHNKALLSIGCYSVHDDVGSGKALPHLKIDWASKMMRMPMVYYQSMFLEFKFPAPNMYLVNSSDPVDVSKNKALQEVPTPIGISDVPSVTFSKMSLPRVKTSSFMDMLENMSLNLPSLRSRSAVHSRTQSEQSVKQQTAKQMCESQSVFVMDPNSMYRIRFGRSRFGTKHLIQGDELIREWEASYSRHLGCSICELIDMRLRYREHDVYVSQVGVFEFTKVSPQQLDEYFVKRSQILIRN